MIDLWQGGVVFVILLAITALSLEILILPESFGKR